MAFEPLEASVILVNDKIKFSGAAGENPPISIDYTPPVGDGEGYTSLQLFLLSLASCSGSSVALLLRRMHKTVSGLTVSARGIRRETHPTGFTHIDLMFTLTSPDVTDADIEKTMRMSEETFCPVWSMVKGNVEVKAEWRIGKE